MDISSDTTATTRTSTCVMSSWIQSIWNDVEDLSKQRATVDERIESKLRDIHFRYHFSLDYADVHKAFVSCTKNLPQGGHERNRITNVKVLGEGRGGVLKSADGMNQEKKTKTKLLGKRGKSTSLLLSSSSSNQTTRQEDVLRRPVHNSIKKEMKQQVSTSSKMIPRIAVPSMKSLIKKASSSFEPDAMNDSGTHAITFRGDIKKRLESSSIFESNMNSSDMDTQNETVVLSLDDNIFLQEDDLDSFDSSVILRHFLKSSSSSHNDMIPSPQLVDDDSILKPASIIIATTQSLSKHESTGPKEIHHEYIPPRNETQIQQCMNNPSLYEIDNHGKQQRKGDDTKSSRIIILEQQQERYENMDGSVSDSISFNPRCTSDSIIGHDDKSPIMMDVTHPSTSATMIETPNQELEHDVNHYQQQQQQHEKRIASLEDSISQAHAVLSKTVSLLNMNHAFEK